MTKEAWWAVGIVAGLLLWLIRFLATKWFSSIEEKFKDFGDVLKDAESLTQKIFDNLKEIKDSINTLEAQNLLHQQHIHEVETRYEMRFKSIDERLIKKGQSISILEHKVNDIEKYTYKIKLLHGKNHPDDNIN